MIKKRISMIVEYFVLILSSAIALFPIFWTFTSATNKSIDVLAGRGLPGAKLFENLHNLLKAA
ncbi:MAG TPA: lactose ABC transporter permease, partial [Clostridiaceae bacterium]|nr:lactose ABC transporter permease [Clostridiaceae bacterium]